MQSIVINKRIKREAGGISLEAALALPLLLLVFLQLGMSIYAISAELSLSSALDRLSKESNLVLASQRQLRSKTAEQIEPDESNAGAQTSVEEGVITAVLKDAALTKLTASLMEERLNTWFAELYDNKLSFSLIREAKIFLELPKNTALGRIHLYYKIPGIWETVHRSQQIMINDWRGYHSTDSDEETQESEEVTEFWSWDNFSRGRAFQEKYGGNLSTFHPVVAKVQAGRVSMIKSIDLTRKTYQSSVELSSTVDSWLSNLEAFNGTAETGKVLSKELLIIVPENSPFYLLKVLESKKITALSLGINIEVIRDGVSKQEEK